MHARPVPFALARATTFASPLLFAFACTDLQSADITTPGISATLSITADGTGAANATAQFNVDTSTTDYVELSSGDSVSVVTAGEMAAMALDADLFGEATYTATIAGGDAPGTEYVIALDRRSQTSAPSSVCTLPTPFTITGPSTEVAFSRSGQDIIVEYGPSGGTDPVSWSVSASCGEGTVSRGATTTLPGDPGAFTIPRGYLSSKQAGGLSGTCALTITIDRTRVGTLDPAYDGGSIHGVQERTLSLTSTP